MTVKLGIAVWYVNAWQTGTTSGYVVHTLNFLTVLDSIYASDLFLQHCFLAELYNRKP